MCECGKYRCFETGLCKLGMILLQGNYQVNATGVIQIGKHGELYVEWIMGNVPTQLHEVVV